jgi:predicted Zn finger-like uncharacterized protein
MIVVCSTCQARFKVADDKIGPRGARVRCSKCQTVFVVHRDLGVVPEEPQQSAPPPPPAAPASPGGGIDLDLEGAPGSGVRPNGFSGNPFARAGAADPFAAAPPSQPAPDPFGAADPFAAHPAAPPSPPPPAPEADPFAAQDPFSSGSGGAFGAVDPFVATVAGASPGIPTSAVTDLSDLLGSAAPEPQPAAPQPEPSGILDSGFDFDPSAAAEAGADIRGPPAPPAPPVDARADLALDERTPAHGMAAQGTPPPAIPGFGDLDPFEEQGGPPAAPAGGSSGFASADFDAFGDGSEAEAEAPPPSRAAPSREPPAAEPLPAAAALAPAPAPAIETTDEVVAAAGFQRSSRARAIAVNAVSLVALLAVVLGMLAFWRGVRPGAAGFFRPADVLGAIGDRATFQTAQVRSGIYERTDAAPLLFVTGKALSHAAAPVAGLRVSVELVRKGAVVARGEARAGPIPSPEELNGFKDAASFYSALARKSKPSHVKPGDSVPFLVAISDFPSDVAGAALRVTVEPVEDAPEPAASAPEAAGAPTASSPEGASKP